MTQICPDCGKKWPDNSNYCSNCRAKLPNAPKWIPDHKKIYESDTIDINEFMKLLEICLNYEEFKNRLLAKILKQAVDAKNSESPMDQYLGDEILKTLFREVLKGT